MPSPSARRQYFEIFSNRAIYDNGWIACAQHTFPWRQDYAPGNWDKDKWELYNIDEDFSEANDLAAKMPEKLAAMKALFDEEAEKNHVYPLDDRGTGRIYVPKPSPGGSDPKRTKFTYYSGAVRLAETAAANTKNRSHTIEVDITMPEKGGEGVLVAIGGSSGGYALYVQDGRLVYHFNWFDETRTVITSSEPVPAGKSTVRFDFAYDGGDLGSGGTGTLFINDKKVGETRIEKTVPGRYGIDTFGVGSGHRLARLQHLQATLRLHWHDPGSAYRTEIAEQYENHPQTPSPRRRSRLQGDFHERNRAASAAAQDRCRRARPGRRHPDDPRIHPDGRSHGLHLGLALGQPGQPDRRVQQVHSTRPGRWRSARQFQRRGGKGDRHTSH